MKVPLRTAEEDFFSAARQMGRWLEGVMPSDYRRHRIRGAWSPSINLYEDRSSYCLVVDLAGVDPKDIELRIEKGHLILSGERPSPCPSQFGRGKSARPAAVRLHLMEINHGPFYRRLRLPESIANAKIEARYRNGFLWVKMPKVAKPK